MSKLSKNWIIHALSQSQKELKCALPIPILLSIQVGKSFTLNPPSIMEIKGIFDALPSTDKPGHFFDSLKQQTRYAQLPGQDFRCSLLKILGHDVTEEFLIAGIPTLGLTHDSVQGTGQASRPFEYAWTDSD